MNRVAVNLVCSNNAHITKLDQLRIVTEKTIGIMWELVNEYKHAFEHELCMGVVMGEVMSSFPDEQKLSEMAKQCEINIIFVDEMGRSCQNGKNCTVYIAAVSFADLKVSIAHELCHALGCFHSINGIMAGKPFADTVEKRASSIDDKSLTILSYGPMFTPRPDSTNNFQYKIFNGKLLIRSTESIRVVVFSRNTMYDELIEIAEPTAELELDPHFADRVTCITGDGGIFSFKISV